MERAEPYLRLHLSRYPSRPYGVASLLLVLTLTPLPRVLAQSPSATIRVVDHQERDLLRSLDWKGWPSACIDTLSAPPMRVTQYAISVVFLESNAAAFQPQADLIAQAVTDRARRMLGVGSEPAASADGKISWRAVPARLVLTAHHDGRIVVRDERRPADSAGIMLLRTAYSQAREHGEALLVWPDHYTPDSVVARLALQPSVLTEITPTGARPPSHLQFKAFSLHEPIVTLIANKTRRAGPDYPMFDRHARVSGNLVMMFVVDTNGRALPDDMHDVWPANVPRLVGEDAQLYSEFVRSVRQWLLSTGRFEPARVGGCPIRAITELPVSFHGEKP